jgi:hypothetical protein
MACTDDREDINSFALTGQFLPYTLFLIQFILIHVF